MNSNLHTDWARLLISTLISAGVQDVVVSPGSRSTPLVLALANHPSARSHVILDERSAAFFALGVARTSLRPVCLICTSGSAAAHYLPALVEAMLSHVPLVVLTADRPLEAYHAASPQTIDQVKLFGHQVRHFVDLGLPDATPAALRGLCRQVAQAVDLACHPTPGPVHVNARFRKPLDPVPSAPSEPFSELVTALLDRGAPRFVHPRTHLDAQQMAQLVADIRRARAGLIVCGPASVHTDAKALRQAVVALSTATAFPVYAEATSGLRFGLEHPTLGSLTTLLRMPALRAGPGPDVILEIGGAPLSATYAQWLEEHPQLVRVVLNAHALSDPSSSARWFVLADPAQAAQWIADALPTPEDAWAERRSYAVGLHRQNDLIAARIAERTQTAPFCDATVVQTVVDALPADATLMLGNSLPVRDVDLFCPPTQKPLRVLHQRGAAGIDGLLAGAAGSRLGQTAPLALLIGDLSTQHDVGSLAALSQAQGPLVVVVVQNGGGRIFAELPTAQNPAAQPALERFFLTPQTVDLVAVAQAFGLAAVRVQDAATLSTALTEALQADRPWLIEAVVPTDAGTQLRAAINEMARSQAVSAQATKVCLHGFFGSARQWAPVVDGLGGARRLLTLPGHGPQPVLPANASWSSVLDELAAQLPPSPCHLLGYSMGARLALGLAVAHPGRFLSLTLVGVVPGLADETARAARCAWEDEQARLLRTLPIELSLAQWEAQPLFATQQKLPAATREAQRAERLGNEPQGLAWAMTTLGTGRMPNLSAALGSLPMPVWLLTGALDLTCTDLAARLASQYPQLHHIVVPQAGHNLLLEAPEAVARAMAPALLQAESKP